MLPTYSKNFVLMKKKYHRFYFGRKIQSNINEFKLTNRNKIPVFINFNKIFIMLSIIKKILSYVSISMQFINIDIYNANECYMHTILTIYKYMWLSCNVIERSLLNKSFYYYCYYYYYWFNLSGAKTKKRSSIKEQK